MFGRKTRRIEQLQRHLAQALGIIGERDDANMALLHQCELLDKRNVRLHHDLKAMRERLPQLTPLAVDEDVTRPYIPLSEEARGIVARATGGGFGGTEVIPDYEDREQPWTEER